MKERISQIIEGPMRTIFGWALFTQFFLKYYALKQTNSTTLPISLFTILLMLKIFEKHNQRTEFRQRCL